MNGSVFYFFHIIITHFMKIKSIFLTYSVSIIYSYLIKRDFVFSRYAGVYDPKPVATVCFHSKHFQRNSSLVLSAAIWNWKWSLCDNRRYKKNPVFFFISLCFAIEVFFFFSTFGFRKYCVIRCHKG